MVAARTPRAGCEHIQSFVLDALTVKCGIKIALSGPDQASAWVAVPQHEKRLQ